jgi:hypothetical protein
LGAEPKASRWCSRDIRKATEELYRRTWNIAEEQKANLRRIARRRDRPAPR